MRKFILYVLSIVVPVFGGMAITNYIIDPGYIYSNCSYIDEVVEGAKRGLNVTNVVNMDERIFKKKLIEVYRGKAFDYLIIGSSRVMTISEDCLKGASALNLGVSGSKLEDMVALYQICKENNVTFKNVIIGVDPTLFNANDNDNRWESIGFYYYAFKGAKGNDSELNYQKTLIQNLFSPSYFKSAITNLPSASLGESKIEYVKTFINDGATKRPDGSIYYDKKYRESQQTTVDADAATCCHGSFNNFNSFSEERKVIFTDFVETMHRNGANIIMWCCPYHPIFYKRAIAMTGLPLSISFIQKYAKSNNFRIIGSFNPDELGLTREDFYDGFHVKKETVDRIISNELFLRLAKVKCN